MALPSSLHSSSSAPAPLCTGLQHCPPCSCQRLQKSGFISFPLWQVGNSWLGFQVLSHEGHHVPVCPACFLPCSLILLPCFPWPAFLALPVDHSHTSIISAVDSVFTYFVSESLLPTSSLLDKRGYPSGGPSGGGSES